MLYIVLPAFNEEANVEKLLEDIAVTLEELMPASKIQAVLVDDGSTDGTLEVARQVQSRIHDVYPSVNVAILSHGVNKGLAEAIKTGLFYCCDKAAPRDIILTMDCDNSHTPGLIPRLARRIREGYDVIIASRYVPGAQIYGLSRSRIVISFIASVVFRSIMPIRGVRDYTCGFRAYRAEVLQQLIKVNPGMISETGFTVMIDILLKLNRLIPGLAFGEVPLLLRYDLKKGASKMNVKKTTLQTLSLLVRRRLGQWDL